MFPFGNQFGNHINQMELYPRRRATEFYYEHQPPEEYQSRQAEHTPGMLGQNVGNMLPFDNDRMGRIIPARNSDMRMLRNSYFS